GNRTRIQRSARRAGRGAVGGVADRCARGGGSDRQIERRAVKSAVKVELGIGDKRKRIAGRIGCARGWSREVGVCAYRREQALDLRVNQEITLIAGRVES